LIVNIVIVLGLLALGVYLFSRETFSVDVITLLLLLGLLLSGILTPTEAFAGFSSDILIILASIFVISAALQETGVLDSVGRGIARVAGSSPQRLLTVVMIVPAAISAFINNTTVTAMFVPPVVNIARRFGLSPSRLLMPLAFASILGGTCTLIGTSTNVAVSGYITKVGMAPLGFFEIAPIGFVIVLTGLAYMFFVGSRLLPDRSGDDLTADYELREYLTEIAVLPNSPLIGQSMLGSDLGLLDFRILNLRRNGETFSAPEAPIIKANDILLVEGRAADLVRIGKIEGIEFHAKRSLAEIESSDSRIAEVVITPRSDLSGQSLRQTEFRQRFGAVVLAIYRRGRSLRHVLADIPLQAGDVLLAHASTERFEALAHDPHFSILSEPSVSAPPSRKGLFSLAVFVVAVLCSALGLLAIPTAFLAAALAVVLARCISMEKAYTIIDWRLLILIGGMTAFGTAMQNSGAAAFLAQGIVTLLSPMGLLGILAGFFVLTILLTQPMSNAAAALVVLPVAIEAAHAAGGNPRTFAIAIMLAASISFITPFEPSCILIYGPGKYRFNDFVRVGGGLTLLLAVIVILLVPVFWPLSL